MTSFEPENPSIAARDIPDTEVIVVPAPSPVFVDSTGRRRRVLRRFAYAFGGLCMLYGGLVSVSLAGGPVSSNAVLPLPALQDDNRVTAEEGRVTPTPAPASTAPTRPVNVTEALPRPGAPVAGAGGARSIPTTPAPSRTPSARPTRTPTPSTTRPAESTTKPSTPPTTTRPDTTPPTTPTTDPVTEPPAPQPPAPPAPPPVNGGTGGGEGGGSETGGSTGSGGSGGTGGGSETGGGTRTTGDQGDNNGTSGDNDRPTPTRPEPPAQDPADTTPPDSGATP